MGKKGKRSKKKDARKEADKILRECDKLLDARFNVLEERLFSKAANQYREVIRLLESRRELMIYTRDTYLIASYLLMHLEYHRRNYAAAINCHNFLRARSKHIIPQHRGIVSLYYQLIMLRLSGEECQLSDFLSIIGRANKQDSIFSNFFKEAVLTFRAYKQFDSAIRLEMMCGSLLRSSELNSKLSLALTYLEQYRVQFRQRSLMRREDSRRIISLIRSLLAEYPPFEGGPDNYSSLEYPLVLAQWYYLSQTIVQEEKSIFMASCMLKNLVSTGLMIDKGGKKMVRDNCLTCGQAFAPDEVQYVCSGCQVACYCSIDHQRATWKKEAVYGTRIGHEILCPLYKAFRKYTLQKASEERDEEKESKVQRRFDRECVKFLEYGLGLKNKCFPCE